MNLENTGAEPLLTDLKIRKTERYACPAQRGSVVGVRQRDSPSTHGAAAGAQTGRGEGLAGSMHLQQGQSPGVALSEVPTLGLLFCCGHLEILNNSILGFMFWKRTRMGRGGAPGSGGCISGQAIQQSQGLQDPEGMVISGIWVQIGSRGSGGGSRNSSGAALGQRGGILVLFMCIYWD